MNKTKPPVSGAGRVKHRRQPGVGCKGAGEPGRWGGTLWPALAASGRRGAAAQHRGPEGKGEGDQEPGQKPAVSALPRHPPRHRSGEAAQTGGRESKQGRQRAQRSQGAGQQEGEWARRGGLRQGGSGRAKGERRKDRAMGWGLPQQGIRRKGSQEGKEAGQQGGSSTSSTAQAPQAATPAG